METKLIAEIDGGIAQPLVGCVARTPKEVFAMSKTVANQVADLMSKLQLGDVTITTTTIDLSPEVASVLLKVMRCAQHCVTYADALKIECFDDIARLGAELAFVLPPLK